MKRKLSILILCAAFAACGGNSGNSAGSNNSTDTSAAGTVDTTVATDHAAESRNQEVDTAVNNIGTSPNSEKSNNEAKVEKPVAKPEKKETKAESSAEAGSEKGKELIAKSDCLSCHKEKEKLVGPAYADVSKKYKATEDNINKLAEKVIKGGAGVWGQIPMTPHPNLSKEDASEMVKYVLSIK
jgi:cytochrome c